MSCWKTTDSGSQSILERTYWQLTMCKQCSIKQCKWQNLSNRSRKLAKYAQLITATFMRLLLMLQVTQLPHRSISISRMKYKSLSFINRTQILTFHPSSSIFHCSLWYAHRIAGEVLRRAWLNICLIRTKSYLRKCWNATWTSMTRFRAISFGKL